MSVPPFVEVSCDDGNDYDGRMGLRISSIFVIGLGSMLGTSRTSEVQRQRSELILGCRCPVTHRSGEDKTHAGSSRGFLRCQVLWFGRHYCYGIHTCKYPILLLASA